MVDTTNGKRETLTSWIAPAASVVLLSFLAACGGGAALQTKFKVAPAPAITYVAPTSGSTSGGTLVTIVGTSFKSGGTV